MGWGMGRLVDGHFLPGHLRHRNSLQGGQPTRYEEIFLRASTSIDPRLINLFFFWCHVTTYTADQLNAALLEEVEEEGEKEGGGQQEGGDDPKSKGKEKVTDRDGDDEDHDGKDKEDQGVIQVLIPLHHMA